MGEKLVKAEEVDTCRSVWGMRIEFYSTLNAWGMRINKCARMRFVFEGIWIKGNLISKLSRKFNMKSQDADSRRKRPDGQTRGGHAPKRVARDHPRAAKTRPKSRFRGKTVDSGDKVFWESRPGTLPPSAPINTPADATERTQKIQS